MWDDDFEDFDDEEQYPDFDDDFEDFDDEERYPDEPDDGFMTDAMADADALASAGHGTDEDYGGYGDPDDYSDSY